MVRLSEMSRLAVQSRRHRVRLKSAMTKAEFCALMDFPPEWSDFDMYPDEVFAVQCGAYKPGDEEGSEHYRNGVFHWWLQRGPTKEQLVKLVKLASVDPDLWMAKDVIEHIRKAENCDNEITEMIEVLRPKP